MSTRRVRLLPGLMLALGAIAAGCSSAASLAPSPRPSPSSAPPSVVAGASPSASSTAPPALTETFTSKMHGISAAYPAGWTARAASEPWTTAEWDFEDPRVDIVHDPSLADHLFLGLGSMALGATSADQWIADRVAVNECSATEPVTVDGAAGSFCADSGAGTMALVSTGGRGYMIVLYTSGDEAWLESVYDQAWFRDVLATVDLRPEDGVDVAPSPSP
jgi:hypothetical protein